MILTYRFRNTFCSFFFLIVLFHSLSLTYCYDCFEWDVTKDCNINNSVVDNLRGGDLSDPSYTMDIKSHDDEGNEALDDKANNNNNNNNNNDSIVNDDNINRKKREGIPAFGRTVQARIRELKKSQIIQNLNDKIKNIEKPSLFLFGPGEEERFSFSFEKMDAKNMAKDVISKLQDESNKVWSFLSGPVTYTVINQLSQPRNNKPLTTTAVFILSFIGSSLGFHSFLYFVSIGFGFAVALICTTALIAFNKLSKYPVPLLSNVHTLLTLLWALRLVLFLLHREFINWPDWHLKIYEVNKRAQLGAKYYVWSTVGPFYAMLTLPCIYRLQQAAADSPTAAWGVLGISGIIMQGIGLLLETVADIQKAKFKRRKVEKISNKTNHNSAYDNVSQQSLSSLHGIDDNEINIGGNTHIHYNRYNWCNEGLWGFSTHPNYLGESLFWIGTYIAGIASFEKLSQWILATIGLLFIVSVLKDACDTLGAKHIRNYGQNLEFMEFRRTHNILGPFPGRSNTIL